MTFFDFPANTTIPTASRVVLLSIHSKYIHSALAVWCLDAAVKRYSTFLHDVYIVEATIHQQISDIVSRVATYSPDVVGISTYIWNVSMLPELLIQLKEYLPNSVIVLGGPEVSYTAELWLAQGADFVLCGEGERSLPALLDSLVSGKATNTTANTDSSFPPLNPYSDTYFAELNRRIAYLETSRGCPFRCAFCLSGASKLRYFPLEPAKEQLTLLSRSGTQTVKLVDRTFNSDPSRAYELFSHVILLDTGVCFHFEVAADLFDDRTLTLLQTAPPGRIQLEIGLQSFHLPALKAVSRRTDLAKAVNAIRRIRDCGNIHVHVDLIAGLPYESLHDFKNSFDRAYALNAHQLQLGFLKLLHGSVLREQAPILGILYSVDAPYEIVESPWLSPADIRILKQTENALQRAYNKAKFYDTISYVLTASGIRPFDFYFGLGAYTENHGEQLALYAEQIYRYCLGIQGIDADLLRIHLICDWLRSTRGDNLPSFLRTDKNPAPKPTIQSGGRGYSSRKQLMEIAERKLGHKVRRGEISVLSPELGVFIDSNDREAVSGLYRLYEAALTP